MRTAFRSRLLAFASATDTHGVKFISNDGASVIKRVVWSVALVGSFAFLSYFFYVRVADFLCYETTTKVDYTSNHKDIPLPTVAVCIPQDLRLNASKLTVDDIINAPSERYGNLMLKKDVVTETVNGQRYLRRDVQNLFREILRNSSAVQSPLAEEIWGASQLVTGQDWVMADYVLRVCRGLCPNWRPLMERLAEHDISEPIQDREKYRVSDVLSRASFTVEHVIRDTQCLGFNDGNEVQCPPWGPHNGRQECFINDARTETPISSFLVVMKSSVFTTESVFTQSFKFEWEVEVNPGDASGTKEQIAQELWDQGSKTIVVNDVTRVERLDQPYGECGRPDDMLHSVDRKYNGVKCVEGCVTECCDTSLETKHGCRLYGGVSAELSRPHLPVCNDTNNLAFLSSCDECTELCVNGSYVVGRGCPDLSCSKTRYVVSFLPVVWTDDVAYLDGEMVLEVSRSNKSQMTTYTQVPLFPVQALLGELGGTMGLFVGISLLTILHFIEFLLGELLAVCCNMNTGKVEENTSVQTIVQEISVNGRPEGSHPGWRSPFPSANRKVVKVERHVIRDIQKSFDVFNQQIYDIRKRMDSFEQLCHHTGFSENVVSSSP